MKLHDDKDRWELCELLEAKEATIRELRAELATVKHLEVDYTCNELLTIERDSAREQISAMKAEAARALEYSSKYWQDGSKTLDEYIVLVNALRKIAGTHKEES